MYYLWLICCCQSCKVKSVFVGEAVYLNRNTVLTCRLLCYKMCIYDFNWLYSFFLCVCVCDFDFIITFNIYVLICVLKRKCALGGAFTHQSDAVNLASVTSEQCFMKSTPRKSQ